MKVNTQFEVKASLQTCAHYRQDNKPFELTSHAMRDQKLDYLHNNPVVEGIVGQADDYLCSSALNYAGLKGLLDIERVDGI